MKHLICALALCLPLAAPIVSADTDQGLYVGFGVQESRVGADQIDHKENSFQGLVGYRFNRFIGTEFGAYDFGKFSESAQAGRNSGKATFEGWAGGIALTGRLPFWMFDVYGKLGLAYYTVRSEVVTNLGGRRSTDNGTKLYGALGGSVNVGDNWSVYLEYARFDTSETLDMTSLGFRFHFN